MLVVDYAHRHAHTYLYILCLGATNALMVLPLGVVAWADYPSSMFGQYILWICIDKCIERERAMTI